MPACAGSSSARCAAWPRPGRHPALGADGADGGVPAAARRHRRLRRAGGLAADADRPAGGSRRGRGHGGDLRDRRDGRHRQDRAGGALGAAGCAALPVSPAPRPALLGGREDLLTDLGTRLSAGDGPWPRIVVLCGLGGAGKTSVAAEYAHRHLAEVGMAWQFAAGDPAVLAAGFGTLAAQLGARDVVDLRDPVASVHAVLAKFPVGWLLIFDKPSIFICSKGVRSDRMTWSIEAEGTARARHSLFISPRRLAYATGRSVAVQALFLGHQGRKRRPHGPFLPYTGRPRSGPDPQPWPLAVPLRNPAEVLTSATATGGPRTKSSLSTGQRLFTIAAQPSSSSRPSHPSRGIAGALRALAYCRRRARHPSPEEGRVGGFATMTKAVKGSGSAQ